MKLRIKRYISAVIITSLLLTGSGMPVYALNTAGVISDDASDQIIDSADELSVSPDMMLCDDTEYGGNDDIYGARETGTEATSDNGEQWDGYIPEEYLTNIDIDLEVEDSQVARESRRRGALPASYRTDASMLPPIKDQNPFGACWTFSTIASCEGSLISNGYASASDIDLSERALCYFLYDLMGVDDPLKNTLYDYNEPVCSALGKHDIYQLGGNVLLAIFFLSNWGTPIPESSAPYQELSDIGTGGNLTVSNSKRGDDALNEELCYDPSFHLKQARIINISDRDGIKRAVMSNGIVSVSYTHRNESGYYNPDTAAYYTGSIYAGRTNHAVNIVGWDDEFPVENFNRVSSAGIPEKPGAWLIRNSYGTGRFDNGYMWISYEDQSLSNVTAMICESAAAYDNNYFYDGTTGTITVDAPNSAWRAANVFTASGNEILRAVSIALKSTDVEYSVQIYKGLRDPYDPSSGTPMLSVPVSGKSDYSGIYTIDLNEEVQLSQGDVFSVVFTLEGGKAPYVEKTGAATSSGAAWLKYIAHIDRGQSFYSESLSDNVISGNGVSENSVSGNTVSYNNVWKDMADEDTGMCFRIHAYTEDSTDPENIPENLEPIQMWTFRSDRVGDYLSELRDSLEKWEPGAGRKWRFEDPDMRLRADDSASTISVNIVPNKNGSTTRAQVAVRVTDIDFTALDEVPQLLYTDMDDIPLSGNAVYVGFNPGNKPEIVYSSSDEDVVRIVSGNNAYRLKIMGEGEAEVTAKVVCDGADVEGLNVLSKKVEVNRSSIKLDKSMLEFNSAVTGCYDEVYITSGYSHETESVTLDGVSGFETEYVPGNDARSGKLTVFYNGVRMARTYDARLEIRLKNVEVPIYCPIRLNVINVQPTLTVSTVSKVDHLYSGSYGAGIIRVTAPNGKITKVKLYNNDKNGRSGGVFNPTGYECGDIVSTTADGRSVDVSIESNGENPKWNKGQLKVWIDGYKTPLTKDISVAYMTSVLKADTAKATVLTSGQGILKGNEISFKIYNQSKKTVEEFIDPVILITDSSGRELSRRYTAQYSEGVFTITPEEVTLPDKGEELYLSISDSSHASAFRINRFKVTGQDVGKTAIMLTKPEVTMCFYENASAEAINNGIRSSSAVRIRNCSGMVDAVIGNIKGPVGTDLKSRLLLRNGLLKITFNNENGDITVSYPAGKHPEAGIYRYKFTVSRDDLPGLNKDIMTTLTVRVKELDLNKACEAKASLKGRLDALDREGSLVEVVPKFSNLPDGYAVRLMELTGDDRDMFRVVEDSLDPSRYYIGLKDGVSVSTNKKYEAGMKYTVYVGGGIVTIEVPVMKLSVTQGKVKLTADENICFSNETAGNQQLTIRACNKNGGSIGIAKLELDNPGKGFTLTDNGDGSCFIGYTPDGSIRSGGSYTLKIRVYLSDGAGDKKPETFKYKVNILK